MDKYRQRYPHVEHRFNLRKPFGARREWRTDCDDLE